MHCSAMNLPSAFLLLLTAATAILHADSVIPPSDPRIVPLGRVAPVADGALCFNWPSSGFSFMAKGGPVFLSLEGGDGRFRLAVAVDDARREDIACPAVPSEVEVALPPDGLNHRVEIRLANENNQTFDKIRFTGLRTAPGCSLEIPSARPARRLLFIGDSFTVGYGAKAAAPPHSASDQNEKMLLDDTLQAYPFLVASELKCDHHVVARSGYGVHCTIDDGSGHESIRNHWRNGIFGGGARVDSTLWVPETVVIRLGANDFSTIRKKQAPSPEQFVGAFGELLAGLREDHPGIRIIVLVIEKGASEFWHQHVEAVATAHGTEFLRARVTAGELGLDWHLTAAGHRKVAETLVTALKGSLND